MNWRRILLLVWVALVCVAAAPASVAPRSRAVAGDELRLPLLVLPAVLDPARWATARCNDGTPFGFMLELSPTGSKDWVIYLEGGGFCEDNANLCENRGPRWSTTPGDEALAYYSLVRVSALFSDDPEWNPSFDDSNSAYAFYCSSDVWSGGTVTRRPTTADPAGWYFSGRANVRALIGALKAYYGLDDTDPNTRVLYAGISAGGQGVQTTAAFVYHLLPVTAAGGRLKLVNDAGSVFVFDHPDYRFAGTDLTFKQVMVQAYDFWRSELNPLCQKEQIRTGHAVGECFDEVIAYPFLVRPRPKGLGLPLFVQHSSIDGFQLRQHHARDPEGTEIFRANTLARFDEVAWTWLWSGGEFAYHTTLWKDNRWDMGPAGYTLREVLSRYWEGLPPEVVIYGNP
jgi:hypothetical protein